MHLAIFCDCTARVVSDLGGNPEDIQFCDVAFTEVKYHDVVRLKRLSISMRLPQLGDTFITVNRH